MAVAANLISRWIKKYKWIAWIGLLAILVVAIELIYTDIKTLFSLMYLKKINLKNKMLLLQVLAKV
jgi:predicted tellurium resistance membrane protein TerC